MRKDIKRHWSNLLVCGVRDRVYDFKENVGQDWIFFYHEMIVLGKIFTYYYNLYVKKNEIVFFKN